MHTYARPHGSRAERQFIARYIACLPNAWQDDADNWHVKIGTSRVMWSCHTDTVARTSGRQRVKLDRAGMLALEAPVRAGSVLGADDTAGVWLCLELIRANVPGHYIFHYGEEAGGIGSSALARDLPHLLDGIEIALALDRAGTRDVITHQGCGRTASDAFAESIASQLQGVAEYAPCSGGIYTDTAEYADLVPECSNLGVGYAHAHTSSETLDTWHVLALRDALMRLDQGALVVARKPGEGDAERVTWPDTWTEVDNLMALELDDERRRARGPFDTIADDVYWDRMFADVQRALREERSDSRQWRRRWKG